MLTEAIKERISFMGKVFIIPGEKEMFSLAKFIHGALIGNEKVLEYK